MGIRTDTRKALNTAEDVVAGIPPTLERIEQMAHAIYVTAIIALTVIAIAAVVVAVKQ